MVSHLHHQYNEFRPLPLQVHKQSPELSALLFVTNFIIHAQFHPQQIAPLSLSLFVTIIGHPIVSCAQSAAPDKFTTIQFSDITTNLQSPVNVCDVVPSDHKNELFHDTVTPDHSATELFHSIVLLFHAITELFHLILFFSHHKIVEF
jgi:hypothetical protein